MELKCKELKTWLLLFLYDNSKFKSIQNHLNPLNKSVNSTCIEKRNNSLNGDLLKKQWRNNKFGFSILLQLKFKTKKQIPFKLKHTPLKNWKNKWKFHLNFLKSI
jgi:hypothetical protein